MAVFQYRARSTSGEAVEGRLEAPTADAVAGQLLEGGLSPVKITEVRAKTDPLAGFLEGLQLGARVGIDDLILFARQMYTLTKAGVPLNRSLRGMAETSQNPAMGRILTEVVDDLESGRELSSALGRHPKAFPLLLCSMVQVGEHTGRLDEAFLQVGRYLELEKETANRVKTALRYPSFVVAAITVAMAILSLFVIPTFEKVFKGTNMELPWATKAILGVSRFTVAWWPYILVALVLGSFLLRRYLRTTEGRYRWGRLKLRLPVVGNILLRITMTRFARAFGMGYGSGVPLVQALSLTARAVDNSFVGGRLEEMREGIERGDTLTRTAAATGLFTPLVLQMLAVGEETGAVDTMLEDVAEFYEREVDYDLKNLSSAIEPILIIAIGAMVLVLALGVFLPMWNLTALARG